MKPQNLINNNSSSIILPKRVRLLIFFIVGSIVLYLTVFVVLSVCTKLSTGAFFPIKSSSYSQGLSGINKSSDYVWEFPLKSLITTPGNVHFHLDVDITTPLPGKTLQEPLVLTAGRVPDGVLTLYREKIYFSGDRTIVRDYHWVVDQNWKILYVTLSSPKDGVSVKINKASLAHDLALNTSFLSVIFNEILLNSKWLLGYFVGCIIVLRLFFTRYCPDRDCVKLNIDFTGLMPWIVLIPAIAFQFHLILLSSYPLYGHDYELLLRAVSWVKKGSFSNFVTYLCYSDYFNPPPLPHSLLVPLIWIFGIKWSYLIAVGLRIFVVWAVWDITKRVYRNNAAAFVAILFVCLLPFNLFFSPLMHISEYKKQFYFDFAKSLSVVFFYFGLVTSFRMLDESKIRSFRIWVSLFGFFGLLTVLTRWETLTSYCFLGLLMFGLVWYMRGRKFLRNYLAVVSIWGVIGGPIIYLYLKDSVDDGTAGHSASQVFLYIKLYFTTDHVYSTWIFIAVPLFFRILMVRFSIRSILMELALLSSFVTVAFGLSSHMLTYSRLVYVFPLQAILAGIGTVSLYQFLVQVLTLTKGAVISGK